MRMERRVRKAIALVMVLLLALIGACAPTPKGVTPAPTPAPTPEPTPTAEQGTIQVRVTDAPPKDISKIMVTVKNIMVHKALAEQEREQEKQQQSGSGNQTQEQEQEEKQQQTQQGEGKWITIVTNPEPFDLVKLAKDGLEKLLGEKEIAAGKYTQIRMEVISVVVTINGEDKPATVPSGKLKIVRPFDVEANKVTTLLLDFDAEKSTVVTGKGDVKFKPVVKLLTEKGAKPETTPSPESNDKPPKKGKDKQ